MNFKLITVVLVCLLTGSKVLAHGTRHLKARHKIRKQGKKSRKLMLPIIKILQVIQGLFETTMASEMKFKKISGGNTSIVMPRDAPTVIVNQFPMRGFPLNKMGQGTRLLL